MTALKRKGVLLRLPVDLHAQLVERAAEQGISLNQLMVALLAGSIRFSLRKQSTSRPQSDAHTEDNPPR